MSVVITQLNSACLIVPCLLHGVCMSVASLFVPFNIGDLKKKCIPFQRIWSRRVFFLKHAGKRAASGAGSTALCVH